VTSGSPVHVVATKIPGTREALQTAAALADGLGSPIRVIAAIPMRAGWPMEGQPEPVHAFASSIKTLAEAESRHVRVLPCLCRHLTDITQLLPPNGLVVMGGRTRRWWPTPEQRLAHDLQGLGYRVMFVLAQAALVLLCALFADSAVAQEPSRNPATPMWQFGSFLDVDYAKDFNSPTNHLFRNRGTTPGVDTLDVNMAGASLRKAPSAEHRWGIEASVHAGKDAETFGFSATAPNRAGASALRFLGPTTVSYLAAVGEGLTVQTGIFSSLIGYDSLYAKDNPTYTRPWGADYTPYLMMGANVSYPATSRLTVAALLVNGYWHLAHANHVPSIGGQLAYKPGSEVTIKHTVLYGPHQAATALRFWRFLSDTIVERKTARMTVAAELQLSEESVADTPGVRAWWISAQLPIRWVVREPWSVAFRPEFAVDTTGRWTTAEQSVVAVTTTLERRVAVGGLRTILRAEHRYDRAQGRDGGFFSDGGLSPGQQLLVGAAILILEGSR